MHIAILEDEKSLADDLDLLLSNHGHEISTFADGAELVRKLNNETYDFFVLDWKVPSMDGYEVLRYIRGDLGLKEPIIFLTSNDTEEDIVKAFHSGADDYCIKPVRQNELIARVNALIRRSYGQQNKTINTLECLASYTFDMASRSVSFNDEQVTLTDKEFLLAHFFFSNIDRPLSRNHLMMRIWGKNVETLTRTLDVHIAWIRNKLKIGASSKTVRLIAIHGYGYRLMQLQD